MSARLGGRAVVRGTARRVVIVPQPGDGPFEQAIFLVRADSAGVDKAALLREAISAATPERAEPRAAGRRERLLAALPWAIAACSAAAAAAALIF